MKKKIPIFQPAAVQLKQIVQKAQLKPKKKQ
jgi:hypothetical protein